MISQPNWRGPGLKNHGNLLQGRFRQASASRSLDVGVCRWNDMSGRHGPWGVGI